MYNENYHESSFPKIEELTADATIVPEPRTLGWFGRLTRQRDTDGTISWNKDDVKEEEMVITNRLQYDPNAPHGGYYVMPIMYAPSHAEEAQIYGMGETAVYDTEQYRNQFYTDIGTCEVQPAEDDDDRLYYKEFSKLETEVDVHQPFVESPVEPHLATTKLDAAVCSTETGQCGCSKRRTAALEACKIDNSSCDEKQKCSEPKVEKTKEVKLSRHDVSYEVISKTEKNVPSTSSTDEQLEKLYISVDTHTDSTVVENRSIQTLKGELLASCSTQTMETPSAPAPEENQAPTPSAPDSSGSKKRTYSILTGQRKTEEDAAGHKQTAKLTVQKQKSAKSSKGEPILNIAKKSDAQLAVDKKRNKDTEK